jgi:hypothetical protein
MYAIHLTSEKNEKTLSDPHTLSRRSQQSSHGRQAVRFIVLEFKMKRSEIINAVTKGKMKSKLQIIIR